VKTSFANANTSPAFLSRLCGGEAIKRTLRKSHGFLSRLCGGEVAYLVLII